jgi:hypothetical protein
MSVVFLSACRKEYKFGADRLSRIVESARDMLIKIDKMELTFAQLDLELKRLGVDINS